MRIQHDCKDCTDVPVLFSLLVNITFQHLFLVQTVGCLTRGGLQCLYMFRVYIRIIMESSTHTPRQ